MRPTEACARIAHSEGDVLVEQNPHSDRKTMANVLTRLAFGGYLEAEVIADHDLAPWRMMAAAMPAPCEWYRIVPSPDCDKLVYNPHEVYRSSVLSEYLIFAINHENMLINSFSGAWMMFLHVSAHVSPVSGWLFLGCRQSSTSWSSTPTSCLRSASFPLACSRWCRPFSADWPSTTATWRQRLDPGGS